MTSLSARVTVLTRYSQRHIERWWRLRCAQERKKIDWSDGWYSGLRYDACISSRNWPFTLFWVWVCCSFLPGSSLLLHSKGACLDNIANQYQAYKIWWNIKQESHRPSGIILISSCRTSRHIDHTFIERQPLPWCHACSLQHASFTDQYTSKTTAKKVVMRPEPTSSSRSHLIWFCCCCCVLGAPRVPRRWKK